MKGKYRLFGKIPVADILVVAVLIAALAAAVWVLTRQEVSEQTGAESQVEQSYPFKAVLMVKDVNEEYTTLPAVGDELYLRGGSRFGKITKIEQTPYGEYRYRETDGKQIFTELEGKSTLYFTVEGEASANSGLGMFIDKNRLAYGQALLVGTEKYYWGTTLVQIEEVAK